MGNGREALYVGKLWSLHLRSIIDLIFAVSLSLFSSDYFTRINLEFSSHVSQEYESYVAYSLQNFIADCGGLIGLFLGFSLLSILEMVYNTILFCSKGNDDESERWVDRTKCCHHCVDEVEENDENEEIAMN